MSTALRGSTKGTHSLRAKRNEVIFVSAEGMSHDMLIAYINLMRNYVALAPLKTSVRLNTRAEQRAEFIIQNKIKAEINRDRSPYSILKRTASVWIQPSEYNLKGGSQRVIVTESVSESNEFLSCILSSRCASIGICICDEDDMQCPLLVQVLDMGEVE